MKTRSFFILALLCLFFSAYTGQAQVLNKKISLKVKDASLPQVLQKIQQQYAIRFSYLNNSLPTEQRFSAEISDKPLAEVLDVLLSKTDIGYLEKNGQVIIKKGLPKKQPKPTTFKKLPPSAPQPKPDTKVASASGTKSNSTKTDITNPETKAQPATKTNSNRETTVQEQISTTDNPVNTAKTTTATENSTSAGASDSTKNRKLEITFKNIFSGSHNGDSTKIQPFHFGFIYPISTNGPQANQYVNRVGAHLLIGTGKGLELAEFAGLASIQKSYVNGAQFSGLMNIVQNKPEHRELALIRNNGSAVNGGQFAGLMNIANGEVRGGQFSGFMNLAHDVKGVQAAGFLNRSQTVHGAQMAGFINIARHVKGVQIGAINIADTVSGVPIGLFNFVKEGGYKRAEFYMADDFDANFTYKLGVHKFYSMIALGAELENEKRWGYGAGFGAEWPVSKLLKVNTDLMSYNVIEESYEDFPEGLLEADYLNLLNKFRLLATLQLARHLALFGGPTYNVMVSRYEALGSDKVGSSLVSKTFYDRTAANGTNVKMWIGFNAGIRF